MNEQNIYWDTPAVPRIVQCLSFKILLRIITFQLQPIHIQIFHA